MAGETRVYGYDANGNAVSATAGQWRSISYTSFNLPDSNLGAQGPIVNGVGLKTTWGYDENHQRIKEERTNTQGTRTTWYLHPDNQGGLGFETESTGGATNVNRHYLNAGGQMVVLVTRQALSSYAGSAQTAPPTVSTTITAIKLEYWHKDHLGSTIATSDHGGAVTARYAYDPFGKRRIANGQYDAFGTLVIDWVEGSNKDTDRGFTGHEHLDELGLIHMNGRIFDPVIGRFLQADPFIQAMEELQNYNRYSYCYGNPLNCTDPTGYFSLKKALRTIAAIVATVYLGPGGAYAIIGQGVAYSAIGNAAIAGFVSGAISSGSLKGALQGAFSAMVFGGVGNMVRGGEFLSGAGAATSQTVGYLTGIAMHGVAGCVTSIAGGGKCGPGALSAAFSKAVSSSGMMEDINDAGAEGDFGARIQGSFVSAVVGGTGSVLGGGKFENGAITGAFSYLLNQIARPSGRTLRGYVRSLRDLSFEAQGRILEQNIRTLEPGARFEVATAPGAPLYTQAYVNSLVTRLEAVVTRVDAAARSQAWRNEQQRVRLTGAGSRDWSQSELQVLRQGAVPQGYFMHHIQPVATNPTHAGSLANLTPVSYREHAIAHGWTLK